MKLLVTGGAGFMGSNFIRYILNKYQDYEVVNFDKLTYAGNLENLKEVENNPRYKFVQGDICDLSAVSEQVGLVDAIINYAAETHVDRSITDPTSFARTDVLGTLNILLAAREGNKKVIQISTDEVFGVAKDRGFKESDPFEPNSPYSASKAGADLMCRAFFVTYGLPVIVTHSCNFYGPFMFPEKLIPLAITNLLEGKKVPIYGDGKQIREWIYSQDHCQAVDTVLHYGKSGEVYNIGTGNEKPNIEVIKIILKYLDLKDDMVEFVTDRPGHDVKYSVDFTKLKTELGWEPKHEFERSLNETIDWYKNNESWWKPLKEKNQEYFQKQYS